jgi:predicted lipid-binding transport protein (Tim44 family)
MFEHEWAKRGLILLTFFFFFVFVLELDALARVGGSRSSGSRGSRTYSAPRTATPSPSQPSKSGQYSQPARPPLSQPMPQPQGGFLRSLAGGIIGGMIGGMLFRSLGFAGGPGGAGGIGIMDIVLIGLILYGIYWFIKKRRREAESGAYYREAPSYDSGQPPSYAQGEAAQDDDMEKGLSHIRQMDRYFDEKKFTDLSMDYFFRIQGAWANRDMSAVRSLLTDEMFGILHGDADKLRAGRRINRLDNIAIRSADITEAWQEGGNDFITVKFYANLLDYTVDEATGQVVEGSKTDPVKFEEYWTFTRPVGSSSWQLSAITQPQ